MVFADMCTHLAQETESKLMKQKTTKMGICHLREKSVAGVNGGFVPKYGYTQRGNIAYIWKALTKRNKRKIVFFVCGANTLACTHTHTRWRRWLPALITGDKRSAFRKHSANFNYYPNLRLQDHKCHPSFLTPISIGVKIILRHSTDKPLAGFLFSLQ